MIIDTEMMIYLIANKDFGKFCGSRCKCNHEKLFESLGKAIPEHQDIVGEFFFELKLFLRSNPIGKVFIAPTDVIFQIDDVVIPDVMFISKKRQDLISKRGVEGAPDLVIEVISPSSVKRDLEVKRKLCQREGVIVYIAVEPETKRVHVWDGNHSFVLGIGETLTCSVLPGFSLSVDKLFA